MDERILFWGLGGLLGLAGLGLLGWALFYDRAKGRKRCPKCWYDMAHAAADDPLRCPECGHRAKKKRRLRKTRLRWRWAVVGVLFTAGGWMTVKWPRISDDGWMAALPNTLLIAVIPHTEAHGALAELSRRVDPQQGPFVELWHWQWRYLLHQFKTIVIAEDDSQLLNYCAILALKCPDQLLAGHSFLDIADHLQDHNRLAAIECAAAMLGDLEAEDEIARVLPRISQLLHDEQHEVVSIALRIVAYFGPTAQATCPVILSFLADQNLAADAMRALEATACRIPASQVGPIMEYAFSDIDYPSPDVRERYTRQAAALDILHLVHPITPEIEEELSVFYHSENALKRMLAIEVLGRFPIDHAFAQRLLKDAIDNEPESLIKVRAIEGLASVEPEWVDVAVDMLTRWSLDDQRDVNEREPAIKTVIRLAHSEHAQEVIDELMHDEHWRVRLYAVRATFEKTGLSDSFKLKIAKAAASDPDSNVRLESCVWLRMTGALQSFDDQIRPILERLSNDPDSDVRIHAKGALRERN